MLLWAGGARHTASRPFKRVSAIEIDTLEYQQTEKIEIELKDVDRIHRIRKVYAS
jgi:hypothetical protein